MRIKHLLTGLALLSSTIICAQNNDDILLTIEDQTITVGEFLTIYNKNNVEVQTANKKSVEDYMELYLNFKLKVYEAEAQGFDTATTFVNEYGGYVNQLAAPYLVNNEFTEDLIKEAYDRMQWEINAKHIMIKVTDSASPEDTLVAWNKINEIYQEALTDSSFSDLAVKYSEDPSVVKNGGDLGYFSAFRMVYPFETAAYNTPVGSVSKPVRSSFGYHIIQVVDKRKARGEMKAAHIMVVSNDKSTLEEKDKAEKKINEIYVKLEAGDDFGQLAIAYSDDRGSAQKGGDLGWFGAGRMVPDFESQAFALDSNGAFSKPFLTQFGWHIVLREDKRNFGSYEEEYPELAKKVKQDQRSKGNKHSLVVKLIEEYNIKINYKGKTDFYGVVDSSYFENKWDPTNANELTKPLITIKDKKYGSGKVVFTQEDFTKYLVNKMKKQQPMAVEFIVDQEFDAFVDDQIIAYEKSVLSKKYPEYNALVTEYHDGILLFEIMDKEVWKRAMNDSAGLDSFFVANQANYMWDERFDVSMFICNNDSVANLVKAKLEANESDSVILAKLNKVSELSVNLRSGVFEKKTEPILADVTGEIGVYSVNNEGSVVIVNVKEVIPPSSKKLDDVRGLVTSAYQDELDKQWVKELREKYTYSINQEALSTIAK